MKNRLTYVASGLSFLRLRFEETRRDPIMSQLNEMWSNIRGTGNHNLWFLYNAFQEQIFESFKDCYCGLGIDGVMADSGGLQVVTQGLSITPELKQKVYDSQAKFSDVAMSFDEIPVSLITDRSTRLDVKNKYFDRDKFEWCARESGRNVRDQILTFIKHKSEARPAFIAQGADMDTYIRWTELALEEIPKELHERIGCVAMATAALGTGMLEDVKRAFYFTQLPIEQKHLHLLGVGSLSRLLPALTFLQSGVYPESLHVSYDSTTHTSGVEMGRYFLGNSWLTPGRQVNQIWREIHEDISKTVPQFTYDFETFHRGMNTSVRRHQEQFGTVEEPILAYNAYFTGSLMNFLRCVAGIIADPTKILDTLTEPVEKAALAALQNVKNRTDFEKWVQEIGKWVPSSPVPVEAPGSLEDLFV